MGAMAGSEKTQIQITVEQHERLQVIKEMLKRKASDDIGLSRQSWEPSFADALEHVFEEYQYRESLEQRREELFGEGDPDTGDSSGLDPDEIDWDKHA